MQDIVESVKSLLDLDIGEQACVSSLDSKSLILKRKLINHGVLPGAQLRVVRKAPLGSPLEVEVCGTSLCLRLKEAACVLLRDRV